MVLLLLIFIPSVFAGWNDFYRTHSAHTPYPYSHYESYVPSVSYISGIYARPNPRPIIYYDYSPSVQGYNYDYEYRPYYSHRPSSGYIGVYYSHLKDNNARRYAVGFGFSPW